MILYIGGAAAGKLSVCKAQENLSDEQICDGGICSFEELCQYRAVNHFHLLTRRMMNAGISWEEGANDIIRKAPGLIIITDEIGYGVVPVDREEREWRDYHGRICTALAGHSEKVYRVICGISVLIKG